jgi:hypothetical protein
MDRLFSEGRLSESLRAHEQEFEAAAQAIPADSSNSPSAAIQARKCSWANSR